MDFSSLPPDLLSQTPLVAILLWMAVQTRREILSALEKLGLAIVAVQTEIRELRMDLGQPVAPPVPPVISAPPPSPPAPPIVAPTAPAPAASLGETLQ